MSYQSIKRVLGETSLERKCRLLFGVCLFFLITISFWLYGSQTDTIVNDQNRQTGKLLVVQDLAVRHWKKWGDQKVRSESEPVVVKMADAFKNQGYEVKFLLPNPPEMPDGEVDKFKPQGKKEEEIFQTFLQYEPKKDASDDAVEWDQRYSNDGNTYYYYQAIRAKNRDCLSACHQPFEATTGIMAGNQGTLGFSSARFQGD
jgi:two-component system, NarL family, sensor histidine kinase BarA